jgi:hypothetical protein
MQDHGTMSDLFGGQICIRDPLTPRSTQPSHLTDDLRRKPASYGAASAGLSSALSSLLSSARRRIHPILFLSSPLLSGLVSLAAR